MSKTQVWLDDREVRLTLAIIDLCVMAISERLSENLGPKKLDAFALRWTSNELEQLREKFNQEMAS